MKKIISLATIFTLSVGLLPSTALASDPLVCSLAVTTASADTSSVPACNWPKGANILIQCPGIDVYVDSTTVQRTVPTASTSDQLVEFTKGVSDPLPIWLNPNDQVIAVRTASGSGTCNFFSTLRKRPW